MATNFFKRAFKSGSSSRPEKPINKDEAKKKDALSKQSIVVEVPTTSSIPMTSTPQVSVLRALSNLIANSVTVLEEKYPNGFPSLDDPYSPNPVDHDPVVSEQSRILIAAAAQFIATVRTPHDSLQELAHSMYINSSLAFAIEANIPDILKDGGTSGVHVNDISAINGVDPANMARVLRFLATRHLFREVQPDVFANNRITTLLQKKKTLEEVKADPVARFDGAPMAALLSALGDDALKSSWYVKEFLLEPGKAVAPFNLAMQTEQSMWNWYENPGNEWRARRLTAAMRSGGDMLPPEIFQDGIGSQKLKADDVVVDVGGNVGTVTYSILQKHPHLRYVVQDLPKQIEEGEKYWAEKSPESISSGRVKLQAYDFFTPQPVKDAALYFMRVVVHDWPDNSAIKIMSTIRAGASKSSKLILFDFVVPYVCEAPVTADTLPMPKAPFPLLANLGVSGGGFVTALDMQMMNLFNGKERTVGEFRNLGVASGWKLETIIPGILATIVYSAA